MRFAEFVLKQDVDEAVRLIRVATQQAATDPKTGLIDMDIIGTGTTSLSRSKIDDIVVVIREILKENEEAARKGIKFNTLFEDTRRKMAEAKKYADGNESSEIAEFELRDAIKFMEDQDVITSFGNKIAPVIRLNKGSVL